MKFNINFDLYIWIKFIASCLAIWFFFYCTNTSINKASINDTKAILTGLLLAIKEDYLNCMTSKKCIDIYYMYLSVRDKVLSVIGTLWHFITVITLDGLSLDIRLEETIPCSSSFRTWYPHLKHQEMHKETTRSSRLILGLCFFF